MGPSEVVAQLEKILSSPQFSQAAGLSRFLRFVVEAAQAGQTVKEYPIGVEVFNRGKDFDPRIDTIVRVQAAKLRSKLLEYYASGGAEDPIVIGLPKGGYVPEIRERAPAKPAAVPAAPPDRSRIAVLPFVNMSSDQENEYFSDGLTEELINRLARVPSLQVVGRTSVFSFKGRNEDLREVGAKLNVGSVMEGSVRKAGDQLRVTAQLIDVQSGYHLFSQTYQRELKNVFAVQEELAQAVVDEIAPLSADPASRVILKTRVVNLDAYNAYLRGRYAQANRFHESNQWIDSFHEALRLDPGFAAAWAGLASGYFMMAWFYRMPAEQAMPLSKEAALKTLDLDSEAAEAHSSLGLIQCAFDWNWARAEASFRRAIELHPGLAVIYAPFALFCLLPQLRIDEACKMAERALSLDPYNPMTQALAIFLYGNAGRFEDALRHFAFGREFSPNFVPLFYCGGLVHEWQGNLTEAIATYRRACELAPLPSPLGALGHALAVSGEKEEPRRIIKKLMEIPDLPAVDLAIVHLGLGDEEEALRWLEVGVEQRNLRLLTIPADRRFRRLVGHRQFQGVLGRMGLRAASAST
jgi:TolB-like protein